MLGFFFIYLTLFVVLLVTIIVILCIIAVVNKDRIIAQTDSILKSHEDFVSLYNGDRYFSKRDLENWIQRWNRIKSVILAYQRYNVSFQRIISKTGPLESFTLRYKDYFFISDEYDKKVKYISNVFQDGLDIIKERNDEYVEKELISYKDFFDSVFSEPLTPQQRKCIVVDEAHNLVVAGAGTGKTRTIVGKAGYLLKKGIAMPDEILMMSFGRGTRDEMAERIESTLDAKVDVRTFHSLGYHIIGHATGATPSISEEAEDRRVLAQRLNRQLEEFLEKRIEDYDFLDLVSKYFTYYLKPVENHLDFQSEEEYEDYLQHREIRTLQGEKVKSYEECMIANFLYLNGIKYEYEKDYVVHTATQDRRQYQPDFYLPDYGIWIEHFGVDRGWNTSHDVDSQRYIEDIYWKRKIHLVNSTHLIETFSYERSEGILISNLIDKLSSTGVEYKPIPREEVFGKIRRLGDVTLFVGLLAKFLNLYKSRQTTITELRIKSKKYVNWKRYHAFLDIFEPLYEDYESALRESGRIDFNDMIIQATGIIKNGDFTSRYKYVLVDEFQDISQSRYKFLKSLLDQGDECKLFCVGDDWQSIYRFTGSDLSIMTDFKKHFGFNEILYLDETFRNNNSLSDFSSRFIMKNPSQYRKNIRARPVDYQAISVVWYDDLNQGILDTIQTIDSIEDSPTEVLVLGRYNQEFYKEIDRSIFKDYSRPYQRPMDDQPTLTLDIEYLTIHRSKGREADYVILIGLRSGTYGFPCEIEDDPVLKLVLSQEEMFPNAEERRLFYVGVTRAKKKVFLLADRSAISSFISETIQDSENVPVIGEEPNTVECPSCGKGFINKNLKSSHYCSNLACNYKPLTCPKCGSGFLYQDPVNVSSYICSRCTFTARICPSCNEGYLVIHEKAGRFWGCSNYIPKGCRFTEPIS
jgi:DNA helicase-4